MDTPKTYKVKLLMPEGDHTLEISENTHIWDAAQAAGFTLPALCHQGRCLTCAGKIKGSGKVDQRDSDRYLPADEQAHFVLLCTGKPRSDVDIETHQQSAMRENRMRLGLAAPYS